MTDEASRRPRAVGRRIGYRGLPSGVRGWVEARFGPVRVLRDHVGGMSAGCATSLRTADGDDLFVKAVGVEVNEQTVDLFRQEVRLLRRLAPVAYRPALRDAFDRDGWVALALAHVPGRYPDLAADADFAAVARTVEAQIAELTPAPDGTDVPPLAVTAERWSSRWDGMAADPGRYLPAWAAARFDELRRRVRDLPAQLPGTTLCHFDVRDDNLLIRDDGRAVILDWGMARLGPEWTDQVLLAVQRDTPVAAEYWLRRRVPPAARDTVTALLVAFGGSQAWNAQQPARPSLPALPAFCRDDAERLLSLARLRLGA
ncbi:MAG: phosphotransferase [Actinocatenispora sp.]